MFFQGLRPDGDNGGECLDDGDGTEFVMLASIFSFSFPPFKEIEFPSSILEKYPLDGEDFFSEFCLDEGKDRFTGEKQQFWMQGQKIRNRERKKISYSNMSSYSHRPPF